MYTESQLKIEQKQHQNLLFQSSSADSDDDSYQLQKNYMDTAIDMNKLFCQGVILNDQVDDQGGPQELYKSCILSMKSRSNYDAADQSMKSASFKGTTAERKILDFY